MILNWEHVIVYSFEKLEAWKRARKVASKIYGVTNAFPLQERYGLVQQIRRAILSVSSNLSEGSGRQSPKDQSHFYTMAYSSLLEVLNQLIFALDQNWIKPEDYQDLRNDISKLTFMINALRNSLNYQLTNKLNPLNHSKPSNLTLRSRSIG